jgi:hypothetical protein
MESSADIDMSFTDMQIRALGINGAFIVITSIVMGIRVYARVVLQKSIGWDDRTWAVVPVPCLSRILTVLAAM